MITAKDIAIQLNISPSTVGRALAGDPRISASTRQKVEEAASALGYVANRAAQMMRGVSSKIVGFVVPDIRNTFYSTMAHALSKCLESGGYQLMLCETDDDSAIELKHLRALASAQVSGVIIVASAKPHKESVRLLGAMPHVQLLRKNADLGDHWFGIDDTRGIQQSTEHLIELGHKRIAYIGGDVAIPTGLARVSGFRQGIKAASEDCQAVEVLGDPASEEFGRQSLRTVLSSELKPTAIILGSVPITRGILAEAFAQHLKVPEQLSIVGFGDEPGFAWYGQGLTTLQMPVHQLATACGIWFQHQIRSSYQDSAPYAASSPAQLILRGSTAHPAK